MRVKEPGSQTDNPVEDKCLKNLIEFPIEESHQFYPKASDDYLCIYCGRSRAFHKDTGFKPSTIQNPVDREAIEFAANYSSL